MMIDNRFDIGQLIYIKTDPEQNQRIVTGVCVRPNSILYEVSFGASSSSHYDFELSEEKNVLLSAGIENK